MTELLDLIYRSIMKMGWGTKVFFFLGGGDYNSLKSYLVFYEVSGVFALRRNSVTCDYIS